MQPSFGNKTLNWQATIIFLASLFVALVGLINSYPTYWIIPRLGPFAPEIIRPLILGASVLLVVFKYSFTA